MKFFALSFLTLVAISCATPENADGFAKEATKNITHKYDDVLDRLMSGNVSEKEFEKLLVEAKQKGAPEQLLLEVRFAHFAERKDLLGVAKISPELSEFAEKFQPEISVLFPEREDWQSIVLFAQAIKKWTQKDFEGFRKDILEAYWVSPRQGGGFAPFIEKIKTSQNLEKVVLDPEKEFLRQQSKNKVKLADLHAPGRGFVLYFWGVEHVENLVDPGDLKRLANKLRKNNVLFTAIQVPMRASWPNERRDAMEYMASASVPNGIWLVDDLNVPLFKTLLVKELPTFVVVDSEGKVTYLGQGDDADFDRELQKVSAPIPAEPNLPTAPAVPAP